MSLSDAEVHVRIPVLFSSKGGIHKSRIDMLDECCLFKCHMTKSRNPSENGLSFGYRKKKFTVHVMTSANTTSSEIWRSQNIGICLFQNYRPRRLYVLYTVYCLIYGSIGSQRTSGTGIGPENARGETSFDYWSTDQEAGIETAIERFHAHGLISIMKNFYNTSTVVIFAVFSESDFFSY